MRWILLVLAALVVAPAGRAQTYIIVTARNSDNAVVAVSSGWTSDVSNTFPAAPSGQSYWTIPTANYTTDVTTSCSIKVPTEKVSNSSPSPFVILRTYSEIWTECGAQPSTAAGSTAQPGAFNGLLVKNSDSQPDKQIVIQCRNVVMSDGTNYINYPNVSVTAVLTQTAGTENGPDDATINTSTSIHVGIFLQGKSDGSAASAVISRSISDLTGPTSLTSGYGVWRLISSFRLNGSSNFNKQFQFDRRYKLDANVSTMVSGGMGTTSTDVDGTAVFSPLTKMAKLLVVNGLNTCDMTIDPFTAATFGYARISGLNMGSEWDLPLSSNQHFKYKVDSGSTYIYGIGGEFGL